MLLFLQASLTEDWRSPGKAPDQSLSPPEVAGGLPPFSCPASEEQHPLQWSLIQGSFSSVAAGLQDQVCRMVSVPSLGPFLSETDLRLLLGHVKKLV